MPLPRSSTRRVRNAKSASRSAQAGSTFALVKHAVRPFVVTTHQIATRLSTRTRAAIPWLLRPNRESDGCIVILMMRLRSTRFWWVDCALTLERTQPVDSEIVRAAFLCRNPSDEDAQDIALSCFFGHLKMEPRSWSYVFICSQLKRSFVRLPDTVSNVLKIRCRVSSQPTTSN